MVLTLFCAALTLGVTLYDLQVNRGEDYYRQSQYKTPETEVVEAGRGQILDRNGRVLVSNKAIYQIRLNTALMGAQRNEILLALIHAATDHSVVWADTLPISDTAPYRFTKQSPYYSVSTDEDGNSVKTLTRLGRLAVAMKWMDDPINPPLQAQAVRQPQAQELLKLMCESFQIDTDVLTQQETRALAGVLYEVFLRSKTIQYDPYLFAKDVDIDFISRIKELSLRGVTVEATTQRQYHTDYAAHLLGRVALMNAEEWEYYKNVDLDGDGIGDYQMNDSVGKEGAERAFESELRGKSGTRVIERNQSGKIVSETWLEVPQPGKNVVLTLDLNLQMAVEDIMAAGVPNLKSKEVEGAACVVLDVNTAEVLASASYPTFSLSSYGQDYAQNAQNPLKPLYNRALQGTYAPGSTFKMVTAVAGLEENIITPSTRILDKGRYTYYAGFAPQCWIYRQQRGTHGYETVTGAIKDSCNYFFYDVGRQLGISRLTDYAEKFGLGEKTGLELTENSGVMAGPAYTKSVGGTWYEGNTLSVAIGQESSQFTPIQLANYIATLVNGGTRNAAHLLKQVKSSDFSQILYTSQPQVISQIEIQDKNLKAVKAGMLSLTADGSVAKYFRNLGVQVGAKTGSAQISAQSESNAVFVCFAPYDKPEIAIAIVVEHGGGGSDLGAMAADILQYYFSAQAATQEILQENVLVR